MICTLVLWEDIPTLKTAVHVKIEPVQTVMGCLSVEQMVSAQAEWMVNTRVSVSLVGGETVVLLVSFYWFVLTLFDVDMFISRCIVV